MASKLHLEMALTARRLAARRRGHGSTMASSSASRSRGDGEAQRVSGVVLPGLPNLHSHAFQRAMAGLTERRGSEADSFWTWREQMYRFVERLTPDDLEAIAAFAYMEMLEAGFTWVAEFHYLHHQPDGRPYDNVAEMSERIVAAADAAGIGLTLLPVLYRQSGFLGKPPTPGAAPLPQRPRHLCAADGDQGARRHHRHRAALAARRHARRPAMGGRHLARPAGAHPCQRADARGRRLPRRPRPAADRSADGHGRGRRQHWCLVHATHADAGERARIARPRPSSASARSPRPISATACSTCRPSSPRTAASASARTPTSASPPPTSCAPSNTASA